MPRPWGLGPVFVYEWLLASRRWQYYAGHSLFVALLLAAFLLVFPLSAFYSVRAPRFLIRKDHFSLASGAPLP